MGKLVNLIGKYFGSLKVTERSTNQNGNARWICECECGNSVVIIGTSLINGHTISCGCSKAKRCFKHGMVKHRFYTTWKGMVGRCYNPNATGYKNYGGCGISVCEEWRDDPVVFCAWCDKQEFAEGWQLDRKDNNGNYTPDNCHFVSSLKQNRNQRGNVVVEHEGREICYSEFVEKFGEVCYSTANWRVGSKGMEPKEAAMTPKKRK